MSVLKIDKAGNQRWYLNGHLHREDGPAVILRDGTMIWYQHGKIHREDGPAKIKSNGNKFWYYQNKKLPNDQNERNCVLIKHSINIILQSESDGHNIDTIGNQHWYLDGKLHREDGPAVIYFNNDKEWWINGKELTFAEYKEFRQKFKI